MSETSSVTNLFTEEQLHALRKVLDRVPLGGMPDSGMGRRPQTVEDLIAWYDYLAEQYGAELRRYDALALKHQVLEHEIEVAGRLFKRMGLGPEAPTS